MAVELMPSSYTTFGSLVQQKGVTQLAGRQKVAVPATAEGCNIARMEFHERLIFARERANLSQSDVARALNIAPQSVQKWEAGRNRPRPKRIEQLAKLLEVSAGWLFTGDGEPWPSEQGIRETPSVDYTLDDMRLEDRLKRIVKLMSAKDRERAIKILEAAFITDNKDPKK